VAFSETIYLNLGGGVIQPISKVTANFSPSNVVIYNGETYRDDPIEMLGYPVADGEALDTASLADAQMGSPLTLYSGHSKAINTAGTASSTPAAYASDVITHTAPRYKGIQRTLWSFAREVSSGVAGFTHVCWADLVESTGDYAAFRMGSAPPAIT
jgi:hypothetical protein